jgi:hypothetical protein
VWLAKEFYHLAKGGKAILKIVVYRKQQQGFGSTDVFGPFMKGKY